MKNVVSIDCGGTNLRVAILDENLNIHAVKRVPTVHGDGKKLFDTIVELIDECQKECSLSFDAIGMSICGIVYHNKVGRCGNLELENGYDFYSLFKEKYPGKAIRIANDGNCSAYVEYRFGANKGNKDSAFITISSGIGLGIVTNGEMLDLPMEGGRLALYYKGERYETEYLCSGNGIKRLCHLEGLEVENAAAFFDLCRKKDKDAMRIYDIWIHLLATFFSNLQLLFNLESYAISGGAWKSKDVFKNDLERLANEQINYWHLNPIILNDAAYMQDVGLAGAASLALYELEK